MSRKASRRDFIKAAAAFAAAPAWLKVSKPVPPAAPALAFASDSNTGFCRSSESSISTFFAKTPPSIVEAVLGDIWIDTAVHAQPAYCFDGRKWQLIGNNGDSSHV